MRPKRLSLFPNLPHRNSTSLFNSGQNQNSLFSTRQIRERFPNLLVSFSKRYRNVSPFVFDLTTPRILTMPWRRTRASPYTTLFSRRSVVPLLTCLLGVSSPMAQVGPLSGERPLRDVTLLSVLYPSALSSGRVVHLGRSLCSLPYVSLKLSLLSTLFKSVGIRFQSSITR
jgi:hypothetical protein